MKIPISVETLLSGISVESTRIEYKRDWNPEPILHTICAFANDIENLGGGYIILGIEERNGIPSPDSPGIKKEDIDTIQKNLLNICNLITPRYIPVAEPAEFNGKTILIIWIYGGYQRPYKCPISLSKENNKGQSAYYIRKLSSTIQANPTETKELFALSETIPFDDRMNQSAEITDLRRGLISNFLQTVNSDLYEDSFTLPLSTLGNNLRIIGGPAECIKPLNVGLMFFHERPDTFFRYARIEIVDKPDETGEGMTEKCFTGPLDNQLRDALAFIRNYVIREKIVKHTDKAEADRYVNYPYAAIEEALTNAVYHKSYQIPEPITVTITPECIEIISIPGPDITISDENIAQRKLVSKRYRNRRIGEFLKELRLAEGRNTGIPTILRSLEQNGSGLPIFETDNARSYFRVVLPVHPVFSKQKQKTHDAEKGDVRKRKQRVSRKQLRDDILSALSENDLSLAELGKRLGYSYPYSGILPDVVNELIEEKSISRKEKKLTKN